MTGPDMTFIYHPVFQSLVLPLFLSAALGWLLRSASWRVRVLAPSLGLVLALAAWPGLVWPALARTQMLPWWVVGATLFAVAVLAWRRTTPLQPMGYTGVWLAALLGVTGLLLAAWGATGGSLLLAQLAGMLATVSGVATVLAWWVRHNTGDRVAAWIGLVPLGVLAVGLALSLAALPTSTAVGADDDDPYYQAN